MELDATFSREIRKIANGDGSREARFVFLRRAREAARRLSTPSVREEFNDIFQEYGRVVVGLCVAVTIRGRMDRLDGSTVRWAEKVLALWTNRPPDIFCLAIRDNLHPARIEEYAGSLISLTTEEG